MKQKFFKKILSGSKMLLVLLAAGLLFVNFGFIPHAYATCSFQVTDFAAKDPNNGWSYVRSASPSNTLTIIGTLKKSGSAADCTASGMGNISYEIDYNSKNGWTALAATNQGSLVDSSISVSDSSNTANLSYKLNLGSFDRSNLATTNQLNLQLKVCRMDLVSSMSDIPVYGCTQLATSSSYQVTISGGANSSGSLGTINVYFKPAQGTGDTIQVLVNLPDKSQVNNLDPSVKNIKIETSVNGTQVGSFKASRGALASSDQYQSGIVVDAGHGFKNDQNTITVVLTDFDTGYAIANGTATLQAQGLSGSSNSGTGSGTVNSNTGSGTSNSGTGSGTSNTNTGSGATPSVDCTKDPNSSYCFYNPLPVDSLTSVLLLIMKGFLGIIAIWAVAFIVIGGFRLVMSQGNEEAVTAARKTITWAVIGLVVAALSFSIIAIVQSLLQTQVKDVTTKTSMKSDCRIIGELYRNCSNYSNLQDLRTD